MITTQGLKTKKEDLKENGNLKIKFIDKDFKMGIKASLIGASVGAVLTGCIALGIEWVKVKWLSPPQSNTISLPKNVQVKTSENNYTISTQ